MALVCRDFAIIYVLAMIGFVVLTVVLESFLGTELGNAFNLIPQIVAAMLSGQRHGKRTGQRPESSFSWRAAFLVTLISTGLSIVFAIGLIAYMGPGDAAPLVDFLRTQFVVLVPILLLVLGVYVLVSRYFFGLGAKQGAQASPNVDEEIFR